MSRAPDQRQQRKGGRQPGSAWQQVPLDEQTIAERAKLGPGAMVAYQRMVHDGHLTAFVDREMSPGPDGERMLWHVSISHRTNTHPPQPGRYPSWDEIVAARFLFMPADAQVIMCLPPRDQWVSDHPTCFHLWELPEAVHITGHG